MLHAIGNFFRDFPHYALLLLVSGAVVVLLNLLVMIFMRQRFSDQQQFRITLLLWASTLFCVLLLAARVEMTGKSGRLFMVWNLFLAWIPYWLTLLLKYKNTYRKMGLGTMALLIVWLAFFPNAPYMVTDLKYLVNAPTNMPFWFDSIMMLSFAWTGLMLGYFSLYKVQQYLLELTNPIFSWVSTVAIIIGASYGIFLGRYQRWNSWDLVVQPLDVIKDIFATVSSPRAIGMTLVLSVFLILGYLTMTLLIPNESESRR